MFAEHVGCFLFFQQRPTSQTYRDPEKTISTRKEEKKLCPTSNTQKTRVKPQGQCLSTVLTRDTLKQNTPSPPVLTSSVLFESFTETWTGQMNQWFTRKGANNRGKSTILCSRSMFFISDFPALFPVLFVAAAYFSVFWLCGLVYYAHYSPWLCPTQI